jgi:UDP-glucose 4-epimerase
MERGRKGRVSSSSKQSIAMTGVRTFLGTNLAIRLQNIPDIKLTVMDKHRPSFLNENVKFYRVDLTDPKADMMIYEVLEKENVETFLHLAFFEGKVPLSLSYAHEVHVIGTWYVLNACAKKRIRKFVLSSTTEVYGAHPMNPNLIKEDAPLRVSPSYKYMMDRVEAEELVRKFAKKNPNTKVFILRKCPILGDRVKNFMTWYLSGLLVFTIFGYDPMMQFIHQEDAIDAFFKVVTEDEFQGGIYNIAGRGALPLLYIIRYMGKINLPLFYSWAYATMMVMRSAGLCPFPPQHIDYIRYTCVADGTKAKDLLGFIPKYSTREVVEEFSGFAKLKKAKLKDGEKIKD